MTRRYWNINLEDMMEEGVHFGHGTKKWNPRMAPYISAKRKEVKHTLTTLRKAEFGFLGAIMEKLTDKPPLLPLYRTVHEIFISYGSSFYSFEVIGSFSSFENLSLLPVCSEE
ncbi:hypothetical protein F8388_004504 [Cannabis sativa]|uniref:Small ribosomal subunit protein uS2c n=1 Tax=Cannabis sativa TaxID=3483 RepID=A0A7J6ENI3_CANSA|nr:hypothetical protein F8388_004504 [Cannabis sativa]